MEFGLLGEVCAVDAGVPVRLGHARQRCVLVVLAVEANVPVPVDRVIDRVWGDAPPKGVRTTLYGYIHHLRRAGVAISRRSGGYVLNADPATIDLHRFDRLIRDARDIGEPKPQLLDAALDLWRGEPFEGMDSPWVTSMRVELIRRRFAVELERNDLALVSGRHRELLAGLSASVAAHPLDERVVGQFMLAAYRCGRQADALLVFEEFRGRLAEELGADPGPELRRLHQRILNTDPDLASHPVQSQLVPRQLPAPPPLFTGRGEQLALLDQALLPDRGQPCDVMAVSAISGAGGVGKTWLALHWAHRNANLYPDGQLYVNLRGFDPGGPPLEPAMALRGFLDVLGVAPKAIPDRLDDRAGIFRSLVAGKRMLILLDNAADTGQVLPLIPGSPSCAVLITSRHRLTGLTTGHGAVQVQVDVLDDPEAHELFVRHVGPASAVAEPAATAELLSACAGLPLAIGIVAARAIARPDFPLAALASELRDRTARLDALDGGDGPTNLRGVLAWSYDALTAAASGVIGLLALTPGSNIALAAAASLTGLPLSRARVVLRELEQAHLVQEYIHGRYRMHDLVRLSAAEHARERLSRTDRLAALHRLACFYLHTTYAADRRLHPERPPVTLFPLAEGTVPCAVADAAQAWDWFAAEHANLLAIHPVIVRRWPEMGWQLAWTMDNFHARSGHVHDVVTMWKAGLIAAEQTGRSDARLIAHRLLGRAYAVIGPHSCALRHLHVALYLAEQGDDRLSQGRIHLTLAMASRNRGEHRQALHHAKVALHQYDILDVEIWRSEPLAWMAECYANLHHHGQAQVHALASLALARRHRQPDHVANALITLGRLAHLADRFDDATEYYGQALAACRESGNSSVEAELAEKIAEMHLTAGEFDRAQRAWLQALTLYETQHRLADAQRIRTKQMVFNMKI